METVSWYRLCCRNINAATATIRYSIAESNTTKGVLDIAKIVIRPAPSPATRAELRRITHSLRQASRGDQATQGRVSIVIDGINESQAISSTVEITISPEALEYLTYLLNGVKENILPRHAPKELTTQQAADRLGVSRPYFIKLLEAGKIPYRIVGHYRRIRQEDVDQFERVEQERRRAGLQQLAAFTQEIGLEY